MDDQLKKLLQEYVVILSQETMSQNNIDDIDTYQCMIKMVNLFIDYDSFSIDEFNRIKRYQSDSLPWTEQNLDIWQKIKKRVKQLRQ